MTTEAKKRVDASKFAAALRSIVDSYIEPGDDAAQVLIAAAAFIELQASELATALQHGPNIKECGHVDHGGVDCLPCRAEKAEAELERIKAALPKTRDNKLIQLCKLPMAWIANDGSILDVTGWYLYDDGVFGVRTVSDDLRATHIVNPTDLYSTRESALAGKAGA